MDACLISSDTRIKCDYAFLKCDSWHFMFVELKGTDIDHAFEQICETIEYFKSYQITVTRKKIFGFIVSSSVPSVANQKFMKLKKKFKKLYGGILVIGTNQIIINESFFDE